MSLPSDRTAVVTTVLLDVNETLTDLSSLDDWMHDQGLPAGSAGPWLAAVLRDGFAATLMGLPARFGALGASAFRQLLADRSVSGVDDDRTRALAEELPAVVGRLPAHDDVEPGIRGLLARGLRVATLTNGGLGTAQSLLTRLGFSADDVITLSVDGTRTWKPHTESYLGACDRLGAMPEQTALVACHPWDILGAQKAGLLGIWIPRGRSWPESFPLPHRTVETLEAVVDALEG